MERRARRCVKGAEIPAPDPDLARQREVVDAFFAPARAGDFEALVAELHPGVHGCTSLSAETPPWNARVAATLCSMCQSW